MLVKQFCIHAHSGKELPASELLVKRPKLPLIWDNKGMYGIISLEKLENAYEALEDQHKLPVLDRKSNVGKFYWDEVEVIPPKVAKLLFGDTK